MFSTLKQKETEWPFDQAKNCAVYTISQILNSESPIHIVYHDLEDNGWQFLSNIEYSMEDAKIVTLEEITKIDPSVFDVAHIKPGFQAKRSAIGKEWEIAKTPLDIDSFIEDCVDELNDANASISEKYGIGHFERWDFDQETAEIVFSENGNKKTIAKVSLIGTYSTNSESWMWGWGNNSLLPHLTQKLDKVREFGEEHNIELLTDRVWSATEDAGWAMAAVVFHIIGGEGVYRGVDDSSEIFFLLHKINQVDNS